MASKLVVTRELSNGLPGASGQTFFRKNLDKKLFTDLLLAMYSMVNSSKGVSSVFLAKYLGVTQKTAWKVGQAVRALMQPHADTGGRLGGIDELDEKYLGGKPRFAQGLTLPRNKGTKRLCQK